jgi:HEAT repeat protein
MDQKIAIWEGAKAIVQRTDLRALPRLIETLGRSKGTEKRAAAAHALGGLHDPRALPALESTLKNKKNALRFGA